MGPRPNGRGWRFWQVFSTPFHMLQWGRDLTDADGCVDTSTENPVSSRFNGAAT